MGKVLYNPFDLKRKEKDHKMYNALKISKQALSLIHIPNV